jgi:hypothetical protein
MLLQKLSGSTLNSVTKGTAAALVRTARRVAAVPTEVIRTRPRPGSLPGPSLPSASPAGPQARPLKTNTLRVCMPCTVYP